MIIKKRLKKLSWEFLDNILIGKMKDNYLYWVEDNNGNRISDDFTYTKKFEYGPFIIMEKRFNFYFVILKDTSNDSLYIEGDIYYGKFLDRKHYFIFNSNNGYIVDNNCNVIEKNFTIVCNSICGYLIYQNGFYGFMDYNGEITVKPQFERISTENCYNKDFIGEYPNGSKIHMNFFGKKLSEKIDIDKMYPFDDNLLYAEENGCVGLIDSNGIIVLPLKYKELKKIFSNPNWLIAKIDDYYGIIDKDGNIIKNFIYSEIIEDIKKKKIILKKEDIINLDT